MKSISTSMTVFAVLLTIWVYVAVAEVKGYDKYLKKLEQQIQNGTENILNFKQKNNLTEKLKNTLNRFKKACVKNYEDSKSPEYRHQIADPSFPASEEAETAVWSLHAAIKIEFDSYRWTACYSRNDILNEIESEDPLGFIVYMTEDPDDYPSFPECVDMFYGKMKRLILKYRVIETGSASGSTSRANTESKCPVCFDAMIAGTPKKPIALGCNHAICETCINKWIDKRSKDANCPICRYDGSEE